MNEGFCLPPPRLEEGDHAVVEEVTNTVELNYFYLTIPNVFKVKDSLILTTVLFI